MANEKRNLGVIVLTNGDTTRPDNESNKVRETIAKIMTQLFDCFETKKNTGSNQYPQLMHISLVISIYSFFFLSKLE